ncbi:hypothetical protein MMYC01_208647, partial [Madurella mycetomatis]
MGSLDTDAAITIHISSYNVELPELRHGCWQQLFDCGVVAAALTQLDQTQSSRGKGLKIPFDLLMQISAVEFPINIQGRMILVGYQTALLPVSSGADYVQFHLEVSQKDQINPYLLHQSALCLDWNEGSIADFRTKDCYLGWCKSARVFLGTKRLFPSQTIFTDAPEKSRSLKLEGVSAGILAASTAPLQAGGSIQANFRFHTNRLSFTASTVFSQMLRNTSMEMALLYDVATKRSWIVPKLSLLLHMCHVWRAVYGDKGHQNQSDAVPFVEPYSDITTVVEALENRGDMAVCGQGSDALSLRTLLIGFNINLLLCIKNTDPPRRRGLYGFDIMEVVMEPGRGSCMRKVQLGVSGEAWLPLASSVDTIVMCADIGDVVCAFPPGGGPG